MYYIKSILAFQGVASNTSMKAVTENTGTGRKEKNNTLQFKFCCKETCLNLSSDN